MTELSSFVWPVQFFVSVGPTVSATARKQSQPRPTKTKTLTRNEARLVTLSRWRLVACLGTGKCKEKD